VSQVDKNDGSGEKVLMQSRRIDGSTTLDMREAAIKEFNSPDTGEHTVTSTTALLVELHAIAPRLAWPWVPGLPVR
jgi:hypothetical protein